MDLQDVEIAVRSIHELFKKRPDLCPHLKTEYIFTDIDPITKHEIDIHKCTICGTEIKIDRPDRRVRSV